MCAKLFNPPFILKTAVRIGDIVSEVKTIIDQMSDACIQFDFNYYSNRFDDYITMTNDENTSAGLAIINLRNAYTKLEGIKCLPNFMRFESAYNDMFEIYADAEKKFLKNNITFDGEAPLQVEKRLQKARKYDI